MYVCLESNWVLEAGVRACFQAGAPTLEQRMAAVAIDNTPAHQKIAAAGSSIRKALDCQTFIVSLFAKGRGIERKIHAHSRRTATIESQTV